MIGVVRAQPRRHQNADGLPDQFARRITEQCRDLLVDHHDFSLRIGYQASVGTRIENRFQLRIAALQCIDHLVEPNLILLQGAHQLFLAIGQRKRAGCQVRAGDAPTDD